MKVYTYFNNIGFEHQDELLSLWKLSWSNQGYQPIVLFQADAENHPLFNEYISTISAFHEQIFKTPISSYGMACWLRWLTYASLPEEKFYVTDYDVINHNFMIAEPDDELHLLNGCCPCAASGTSNQFEKLTQQILFLIREKANDFAEIIKDRKYIWFHDQEFFLGTYFLNLRVAKLSEDRTVRFGFPGEGNFWEKQLVHYSTSSCKFYCNEKNLNYSREIRYKIAQQYFFKKFV